MPELTTHYTPPIGVNGERAQASIVTPSEQMRVNLYKEAWNDLADRGWNPATVINLHPFTLYGNGVLLRELKIPGVPRDAEAWKKAPKLKLKSGAEVPYFKYVFKDPAIVVLEQVTGPEHSSVGMNSAKVTLPIRFVEDLYQQNLYPVPRGGVFGYIGDHDPMTFDRAAEFDREQDRFETAHAQQMLYYNQLLEQANAAFQENNRFKIMEITNYHRWATRYLRNLGLLASDPPWLALQVKPGPSVTQPCICG